MTWTASTNNPFNGYVVYGLASRHVLPYISTVPETTIPITLIPTTSSTQITNYVPNTNKQVFCVAAGAIPSYTFDGEIWYTGENPFPGGAMSQVAYNGSYWVAVGNNGGFEPPIAVSLDGINWKLANNNPFLNPNDYSVGCIGVCIAWNGSYWIAGGGGFNDTVSTRVIGISYDGYNWEGRSTQISPYNNTYYVNNVAWNGNMWIGVASPGYSSNNTTIYSTDGINWLSVPNGPFGTSTTGRGIAWNGTMWVVVGQNPDGKTIMNSFNGMDWNIIANSPFSGGTGYAVAWNGLQWCAVGTNSDNTVGIAVSSDGWTWTASTNNPFTGSYGSTITWNGQWIAIGNGLMAKSSDGMNWTSASSSFFYVGVGPQKLGKQGATGATGPAGSNGSNGSNGLTSPSTYIPVLNNITQDPSDPTHFYKTSGSPSLNSCRLTSQQSYRIGAYLSVVLQTFNNGTSIQKHVISLDSNPTSHTTFDSTDYSFYFDGTDLFVVESGTTKFTYGAYTNEILNITYNSKKIYYIVNGVVIYTTTLTSPIALYLSGFIFTQGSDSYNSGFSSLIFGPAGNQGDNTAVDSVYTPATSTNWADPAPTTVQQALDRMAALLFTLNSNTAIP
jgi:hypothetical protein